MTQQYVFISDQQVAAMLSIGRATVHRWVRLGLLPKPYKLGLQASRFKLVEIENLIETRAKVEVSAK
jgi:predicted DNA-binding transcriptional regulator AlpA